MDLMEMGAHFNVEGVIVTGTADQSSVETCARLCESFEWIGIRLFDVPHSGLPTRPSESSRLRQDRKVLKGLAKLRHLAKDR
jgi:hypothetical protein